MVGSLALGGLATSATANQAGEKDEARHAHRKLSLSEVPDPVRATFEREASGGPVQGLRRETKKGKTVYEGEIVAGGQGTDLQVAPDGTILVRSAPHDVNEATER
jgi:hypothetical protein